MDTLDIILQLQADPARKAQLRAVLLGEEVLGLPELVKDNSRHIAALTERMERVDEQIAALTEAIKAHDKRLQRLESQVGEIDGGQLEDDVRNHPRQYLRRIDMTGLRTLSDDERDEVLHRLAENDQLELDRVDAMLVGNRMEDGKQAYVAVEASATAESHDLERALKRAQLLAKATHAPALPLVVTRYSPGGLMLNRAKHKGIALSTKHDGLVLEGPWINGL